MPDVVLNKKESIERCIKQIRLYYGMPSEFPFEKDFLKQDAIAVNLQRAAELTKLIQPIMSSEKENSVCPKTAGNVLKYLSEKNYTGCSWGKAERHGRIP